MDTLGKHLLFKTLSHTPKYPNYFGFFQLINSMIYFFLSSFSNCACINKNNICIIFLRLRIFLFQQRSDNFGIVLIHLATISLNMKGWSPKLLYRQGWGIFWLLIDKILQAGHIVDWNFIIWGKEISKVA